MTENKVKDYSDPEVAYATDIPIRWSDMDIYLHVNHARTITLLEEARVAFIANDPSLTKLLGLGIVVADLHVQYKGQIRHADTPLRISIWISELRASDFILEYRVRLHTDSVDSRPAVVASTRMVRFDLAEQRVQRFPESELEVLYKYVADR